MNGNPQGYRSSFMAILNCSVGKAVGVAFAVLCCFSTEPLGALPRIVNAKVGVVQSADRSWEKSMFENITVVGSPLQLSTGIEVDALQAEIAVPLPLGYREYVMQFGDGILGGNFIRIYLPRRILLGENNYREWRERIKEYWFWDDGRDVLTREQAQEAIIIGDTLEGDELVIHASRPGTIFVLPRNSENIYLAGKGLPEAIEWLCGSGVLTDPFPERIFRPAGKGRK